MRRKAETRDDRGVAAIYRDPMIHGSQLGRAERERINGSEWRRRLLLVLWCLTGVALIPLLIRLFSSPVSDIVRFVVLLTVSAFVSQWVLLPPLRRALWERRWKSRYKGIGHCPACQYDLRALAPEDDGCTVCPECGAAWKMGG